MADNNCTCTICNGNKLVLKYESTFVYSYVLDSDEPGRKNSEEFLSFLYDNRELTNNRRYIECDKCGAQYPYTFIYGVLKWYNQRGRFPLVILIPYTLGL